jgi:hypothetical protein
LLAIKNKHKIIIISFICLAIITGIYFFITGRKFNILFKNFISKQLSEYIGSNISIGNIRVIPFKIILINDLLINDQNGDSLFYSKAANIYFSKFDIAKKDINIRLIKFKNASVKFYLDSTNTINFQYIIDAFSTDTVQSKSQWNFTLKNIDFKNSDFLYKEYNYDTLIDCINFSDIKLSDLNFNLRNINLNNDYIAFDISKFYATEKSGFEIIKLKTHAKIDSSNILLKDLKILTNCSDLKISSLNMNYDKFDDFAYFIDKVKLSIDFLPSEISFVDIEKFIPDSNGMKQKIKFSGKLSGTISNLKGYNISVETGLNTSLLFDFNVSGLPDIFKTFIFLDIRKFTSNVDDINNMQIPVDKKNRFTIDKSFMNLGKFSYSGNFTGFLNNFVAYGTFNSNIGKVVTDILLTPLKNNILEFKGKISTENFNIGKLTGNDKLIGNISLSINSEGQIDNKNNLSANINGLIENFNVNGYNYKNITITGELNDKAFNGKINIDEPNIKNFIFSGTFDFSRNIPEFNFKANVDKINLLPLNIINSKEDYSIGFNIMAETKGKSVDDIFGYISIENSWIKNSKKNIYLKKALLKSEEIDNSRIFSLKSDFIDFIVKGNFKYSKILNSLYNFIGYYFPAISNQNGYGSLITDTLNNFDFTLNIKDINPLLSFMNTGFEIAPNSNIYASFMPKTSRIKLNFTSEYLKYQTNTVNNLIFNLLGNDSLINLQINTSNILIDNYFAFENFSLQSKGKNNKLEYNTEWNNQKDTIFKRGKIYGQAVISKNYKDSDIQANIEIFPSEFIILSSKWFVDNSEFVFDTTGYKIIKPLNFHSKDRFIEVRGNLTDDKNDTLCMELGNIEIDDIDKFLDIIGFSFKGLLNGKCKFSNIFKNPVFEGNFSINNFNFNKLDLGELKFAGKWNNKNKLIDIEINTVKEKSKSIISYGFYNPLNDEVSMNIKIDKLRMIWLNPLLYDVFSNINGLASGDLILSGTLSKPLLNGKVNVQKGNLTLDYLKTTYIFTHTIEFENNNIIFSNLPVTDLKNNIAVIDGKVNNKYFDKWNIDLLINANNLQCMNLNANDNSDFFGNVYASGIVKISGPVENIEITGSLKNGKNSYFFIPMKAGSYISENNFISFVSKDTTSKNNKVYTIKSNSSALTLNLDLEINNELESQIIFDPRIGDIIKARGNGNIKLILDKNNDIQIFGDYIIQSGDYLFTLQNIINKKFVINENSLISWKGNPYEANINIEAIYSLKTSIKDYLASVYGDLLKNDFVSDKRVPVDCKIWLTGSIMNPVIKTAIDLPNASEDEKLLLRNALSGIDFNTYSDVNQVNEQFISLLLINQFMPNPSQFLQTSYQKAPAVTTYEFFSNQINNMLSQLTGKWEIGLSYRPPAEFTTGMTEFFVQNQMEVALSRQILNNRMTINGNIAYANNPNSNSLYIGDFDIEYKITPDGKLKIKAYHRTNDQIFYELSPHTQGIGLYYFQDFNTINEIFKKKTDLSDTIKINKMK